MVGNDVDQHTPSQRAVAAWQLVVDDEPASCDDLAADLGVGDVGPVEGLVSGTSDRRAARDAAVLAERLGDLLAHLEAVGEGVGVHGQVDVAAGGR